MSVRVAASSPDRCSSSVWSRIVATVPIGFAEPRGNASSWFDDAPGPPVTWVSSTARSPDASSVRSPSGTSSAASGIGS